MKGTKVSKRYAQALLDLAIEQSKVDTVAADMQHLASTCAENRDFELMLESPIVKTDKKIAVLKAVFDQFDQLSALFVELIAKNRREALLPTIAKSFDALLKEFKGIVPVTLISATALDASVKTSILAKIEAAVKGSLEVKEEIDPSLIGGFVVRMGDTQIDASIASQLNNLKQRLTK